MPSPGGLFFAPRAEADALLDWCEETIATFGAF
jgi:hypothetical protein